MLHRHIGIHSEEEAQTPWGWNRRRSELWWVGRGRAMAMGGAAGAPGDVLKVDANEEGIGGDDAFGTPLRRSVRCSSVQPSYRVAAGVFTVRKCLPLVSQWPVRIEPKFPQRRWRSGCSTV